MIQIISDSTSDLSKELLARYNIAVLPLNVTLGDKDYKDGVGIAPEDLYKWSDENKSTPKTAAFSTEDAVALFRQFLDDGKEIICLSISGEMSASGNIMRMATEELNAEDRITVVDSANLSTGVGLLVIEAAILAQQGKTRAEISAHLEALKPLVRASFVVDTLTYLHRGGRCSGVAALLGSTLKLHPRIGVENGKMSPGKKYRGKMSHVIKTYVSDMETDLHAARPDRVFITHSGCNEDDVAAVSEYLQSLHHFNEIHITRAGSVISSHCGPGTLGVLFIAGESD